MRYVRGIRVRIVCLIFMLCSSLVSYEGQVGGSPGCVFRCERSIDTTECQRSAGPRFGAARTCEVVSNCYVHAMDPDGPGGAPPILVVSCTYDCAMEYCVWV